MEKAFLDEQSLQMNRVHNGITYILKRHIVQCRHCKDVIETTEEHDFQECSCKKIAVDGGIQKGCRRLGLRSDVLDLSVWVSKECSVLPQEIAQRLF